MCGRYTITVSLDELLEMFMAENVGFYDPVIYQPRYNVAPGQLIPAVINHHGNNRLGSLHWGLIPSWSDTRKPGFQTINARAETLIKKPAFRASFQRKRCLIPADGFYEWKKSGSHKQPYRITLKDRSLFAMAGLYDTWHSADGTKVSSCTIITTKPNDLLAPIHNRMPVILPDKVHSMWLDRNCENIDQLQALLLPYDSDQMVAYPVSSAVGNVRNEDSSLINELLEH